MERGVRGGKSHRDKSIKLQPWTAPGRVVFKSMYFLSGCNSNTMGPSTIDGINCGLEKGGTHPMGLRNRELKFVCWTLQNRKESCIAEIRWLWGMVES